MPFIKSNVHTHTTFCDGQDSMEDMVKAAVSLGFDTLGFSFHSYTPFDPSYCIRDYYEYMREFERLRKEYGQTICLLNGVELDLYGERPSVCDFVIGSVHYLEENGRRYPVDFSARGFSKLGRQEKTAPYNGWSGNMGAQIRAKQKFHLFGLFCHARTWLASCALTDFVLK